MEELDSADPTYSWISNIISSCKKIAQIEPCEVLISFYEKKGAPDYIINKLKVSLDIQKRLMKEEATIQAQLTQEQKVRLLFNSGKYTMKEVSDSLKIKYQEVQKIINKMLKQ